MKTQYSPIEPGNPETDFFYYNTPAAFHTWRALELIEAAERAGLLAWTTTNAAAVEFLNEAPEITLRPAPAGPIKTRAQLAYWCKLASTYLGIDRGATTNWKPFEAMFGKGLKGTLHDIDYTAQDPESARQEYTRPIDVFFATLNTSTNEQ